MIAGSKRAGLTRTCGFGAAIIAGGWESAGNRLSFVGYKQLLVNKQSTPMLKRMTVYDSRLSRVTCHGLM